MYLYIRLRPLSRIVNYLLPTQTAEKRVRVQRVQVVLHARSTTSSLLTTVLVFSLGSATARGECSFSCRVSLLVSESLFPFFCLPSFFFSSLALPPNPAQSTRLFPSLPLRTSSLLPLPLPLPRSTSSSSASSSASSFWPSAKRKAQSTHKPRCTSHPHHKLPVRALKRAPGICARCACACNS